MTERQRKLRWPLFVASVVLFIALITISANFSSFERDKTHLLTISLNTTIEQGTELSFRLENVSSMEGLSAIVHGQIETCDFLERRRPGLICAGKMPTVQIYLNGRGPKVSKSSGFFPVLFNADTPVRETFFRFGLEAAREGENKILLYPLTPRHIERVEIWVTWRAGGNGVYQ